MNDLITGYSALHLKNFSAEELDALASHMIETGQTGLTYRCYGGGNVTDYVMDEKLANFIKQVGGEVVLTWTKGNATAPWADVTRFDYAIILCENRAIPIKAVQWRNELYLFDEPVWWRNFWEWRKFTFAKKKYYRELADKHMAEWWNMVHFDELTHGHHTTINLPLKVNQNVGFKAYAAQWLQYLAFSSISLHVYGVPASILRDNLQWYKENTNRTIHIYEFNGQKNQRGIWPGKNTPDHKIQHDTQLGIIKDVLGDQLGDILYFTLAGNDTTAGWEEPPYLHKYQVMKNEIDEIYEVINTIENVWP